ncbi:hypothetical protein [Pseudomonas moraviensis]|uniref:hypothetical protein n=1 Tax=Pseudomonas moraviensis TaxID=321662 RepID=UPI0012DF9CD5|nr:hypothetical protein [Pseudomonas moraviensis]
MGNLRIITAREKLNQAFVDYVLGFAFYKETKDSRPALKRIIYPIYISFQIVLIPLFTLLLICLTAMLTTLAIMPFENNIVDFLANVIITLGMLEPEYYSYSIRDISIESQAVATLYFYLAVIFVFTAFPTALIISDLIEYKEEHDKN